MGSVCERSLGKNFRGGRMSNEINHKERAHASYGPSSSSRWMSCTGSVPLTEDLRKKGKIVEGSSSLAADTGTFLHEVAEEKLRNPKMSVKKLVGKRVYTRSNGSVIEFTKEMCEDVEYATKEARAFMKLFPNAHWDFEVALPCADGIDECWGTAGS